MMAIEMGRISRNGILSISSSCVSHSYSSSSSLCSSKILSDIIIVLTFDIWHHSCLLCFNIVMFYTLFSFSLYLNLLHSSRRSFKNSLSTSTSSDNFLVHSTLLKFHLWCYHLDYFINLLSNFFHQDFDKSSIDCL